MQRYRLPIHLTRALFALCLGLLHHHATWAQTESVPLSTTAAEPASIEKPLAVFDEIWQTVQERFYDRTLRGLDWQALREQYRPLVAAAPSAGFRRKFSCGGDVR